MTFDVLEREKVTGSNRSTFFLLNNRLYFTTDIRPQVPSCFYTHICVYIYIYLEESIILLGIVMVSLYIHYIPNVLLIVS